MNKAPSVVNGAATKPTRTQIVLLTIIICLIGAVAFAAGVVLGYYANEEPFDYTYEDYYGVDEKMEDLGRASARRLHPTYSKPTIYYSVKETSYELKNVNRLTQRISADATYNSFKVTLDQAFVLADSSTTVVGIIDGLVEPEHYIIVGSCRDRRNSQELNVLANVLMRMKQNKSWRPRRSVLLISWSDQDSMKQWTSDFKYKLNGRLVTYFDLNSINDDQETIGHWNWLYADFLKTVSNEINNSIGRVDTGSWRVIFLVESIVRLSAVEALPINYSKLAQRLSGGDQPSQQPQLTRVFQQVADTMQRNLEKGISNGQHELVNDRAIKMQTMLFFANVVDNTAASPVNQMKSAILILRDGFDPYRIS